MEHTLAELASYIALVEGKVECEHLLKKCILALMLQPPWIHHHRPT
jgi:hypothetical protein